MRHLWRSHGEGSAPRHNASHVTCNTCGHVVSSSSRARHFKRKHPDLPYSTGRFTRVTNTERELPHDDPGPRPAIAMTTGDTTTTIVIAPSDRQESGDTVPACLQPSHIISPMDNQGSGVPAPDGPHLSHVVTSAYPMVMSSGGVEPPHVTTTPDLTQSTATGDTDLTGPSIAPGHTDHGVSRAQEAGVIGSQEAGVSTAQQAGVMYEIVPISADMMTVAGEHIVTTEYVCEGTGGGGGTPGGWGEGWP